MRTIALVLLVSLSSLSALGAQDKLVASPALPKPDGVVAAGEYQYSFQRAGMTISATLGSDGKLYLAAQSPAAGWVALGVGGTVMNGSRLFIALDAGGKQAMNERIGVGRVPSPAKDSVLEKWAVKTVGSQSTLEIVLPRAAAATGSQLGLLFSYSTGTNMEARHAARGAVSLGL